MPLETGSQRPRTAGSSKFKLNLTSRLLNLPHLGVPLKPVLIQSCRGVILGGLSECLFALQLIPELSSTRKATFFQATQHMTANQACVGSDKLQIFNTKSLGKATEEGGDELERYLRYNFVVCIPNFVQQFPGIFTSPTVRGWGKSVRGGKSAKLKIFHPKPRGKARAATKIKFERVLNHANLIDVFVLNSTID